MNRKRLFGFEDRIDALAPAPGTDDDRSLPLAWFAPATAMPIAMVAFVLAALGDLLISGSLFGAGETGDLRWRMITQVVSLALLFGGVAGLILSLLAVTLCHSAPRLARHVGGIAAAALVLLEGPALLGGEGLSRLEHAALLRPLLILVGAIMAYACLFLLVRRLTRPRRLHRGTLRFWISAMLFVSSGAAMVFADARFMVGGYPGAHRLALFSALLFFAAFATEVGIALEDRVPRRGKLLLTVTLTAIVLGFGLLVLARQDRTIHALRGRLLGAEHPFSRKLLAPLENWVLDRIAALDRPAERNASELLARAFRAPPSDEVLDLRLGDQRRRFNVVFIATDTLRHDAVGWSQERDHELDLTPNLDRFAARSLVFDRAYSPYPTSSYAYSSALTGLYPRWSPARAAAKQDTKTDRQTAIAEVLRAEGYATWASTAFNAAGIDPSGPFGHTRLGFDLVNPRANVEELTAPEVTASAIDLIDGRDPQQPFMLWVHYMDPHASYRPHSQFAFGKSPRDLYRGEVAYMDHHMAPLLDRLSQSDLSETTIVVIFADHGEAFDEHETSYHNSNLHDEQIRIPALLRTPGLPAGRSSTLFNLVDLSPTILGLTGHRDGRVRQGRDLSGAILGLEESPPLDFAYAERFPRDPLPGRGMERALVFKGLKLLRFAGDPSARIFDLAKDPAELHDVFDPDDEEHQLMLGFMSALDRRIDQGFGAPAPDLTGEMRKAADQAMAVITDDNRGDDFGSLVDLAQVIFDGEKRYQPQVVEALGAERMGRIRDLLIAVVVDEGRDPLQRQAAFTFLISLPQDELEGFMRQCLAAPSIEARRGAALWLAQRGDDGGRDLLLASLDDSAGDWCMTIAPALARLGERRAIPWLLPGLERSLTEAVETSVRALADLGHVDLDLVLRRLLASDPIGLGSRAGLVACAEAMAGVFSPEADFVLARIAQTHVPAARRIAREALASRCTDERLEALMAMATQEILGDQAWIENDPARALLGFDEALDLAAKASISDAFLALKTARCRALAGDRVGARAQIESVLEQEDLRLTLREEGRALLGRLAEPRELTEAPSEFGLRASLRRADAVLPRRPGEFFARRLSLVREQDGRLLGGAFPHAARLAWYFRDEQGAWVRNGTDRRMNTRFLPGTGLAAGESVDLVTIGRMPLRPGRYTPALVVARESWFTEGHEVLIELPPVEVW